MKTLTKFVLFSFTCLITYTIASQILAVKTGIELSTLTGCFFAAFGGEVLTCAVMKILKLKGENHADDTDFASDMQSDDGTDYGSPEEDDLSSGR